MKLPDRFGGQALPPEMTARLLAGMLNPSGPGNPGFSSMSPLAGSMDQIAASPYGGTPFGALPDNAQRFAQLANMQPPSQPLRFNVQPRTLPAPPTPADQPVPRPAQDSAMAQAGNVPAPPPRPPAPPQTNIPTQASAYAPQGAPPTAPGIPPQGVRGSPMALSPMSGGGLLNMPMDDRAVMMDIARGGNGVPTGAPGSGAVLPLPPMRPPELGGPQQAPAPETAGLLDPQFWQNPAGGFFGLLGF